jgi:hypothetical protein
MHFLTPCSTAEAYVLDPLRRNTSFGGSVIDTLVEKIEGAAGSDMAVVLAGYEGDMRALIRNCGNPGFARRFNVDEALLFEDYTDSELRDILKAMVVKAGLVIDPETATEAVRLVAEGRRLPAFGNAGAVENILGRAKVNKAVRLSSALQEWREGRASGAARPHPDMLLMEDFTAHGVLTGSAKDMFSELYNVEHIYDLLDELEALLEQGQAEGKSPPQLLAGCHMIFLGPPGTGVYRMSKPTCFVAVPCELIDLV